MSVQLSGASEQVIQSMHLPQEDQEVMRGIISRYSLPQTFCEALSWIVYRIVNAFASLCGMSDWQKAQEMIRDAALRIANAEGVISAERLERNDDLYRANAVRFINNYSQTIGNGFLDLCLRYNSDHTQAVPEGIRIPHYNLTELVGSTRESIEGLRVQALAAGGE